MSRFLPTRIVSRPFDIDGNLDSLAIGGDSVALAVLTELCVESVYESDLTVDERDVDFD